MKKRILFINGHLNVGGCERSLVDVLKQMDYNKYDIDLLLLEELGDYIEEIPQNVNVVLYSLSNTFGRIDTCLKNSLKNQDWFSLIFRIVHLLALKIDVSFYCLSKCLFKQVNNNYDTIIAYRPGICTYLAAFVLNGKKKISWWHHGELNYYGKDQTRYLKAYKKMDHIVAVSNGSANIIRNNFKDVKDKVLVIPNMIDVDSLKRKADEQNVVMDNKCVNLVSVGRMSPEKNMKICPTVGSILKQKGIRFKWYLIGDGEEEKCIRSEIINNNLEKEIIILGKMSNPYPYIKNADILVHPSLVESQGITILESMALNTPVVVAASEGPKEFIRNNINGCFSGFDAEDIVEKILYLIDNKDFYSQLKSNTQCPDVYCPVSVSKCIEKLLMEE